MISQSITNIRMACDIIYHISHVILDVKCESQYPSVQATVTHLADSGAALKAVPKLLSKHTVAYIMARSNMGCLTCT
jgi:hypothetical protein